MGLFIFIVPLNVGLRGAAGFIAEGIFSWEYYSMWVHELRHSPAMILMVVGVHPKMVQERMGHSTIAMTMDIYSHVMPSMQQEVAEKIDDLFKQE
jgi:integrase